MSYALFVIPGSFAGPTSEWPHGPLRALTHVLGETLREFAGVPMTRLVQPLGPTATTAFVESTLELPSSGAAWIGMLHFTYTSKTDGTLTGLVCDVYRTTTINTYADVRLDPRSVGPT